METSRDSSVWRSLAVTFGGGLALGAVGMKLTQSALRPLEAPSQPNTNPLAERLDRIEQRIQRIEHMPAAGPAAVLDQKAVETVVNAVNTRLQEHAAMVDRRLAELEARITAELQLLHAQDRADAQRAETRIAEVQKQFQQQVVSVRTTVQEELGQFGEAVSAVVANQVASQVNAKVAGLEQSVEARIVTAVAGAAAAKFEEQLSPLRAEVDKKERELTELRQRLTESERTVLDVILAIGQVCRDAASRIGVTTDMRPPAPPEVQPAPTPSAPAPFAVKPPAPEAPPAAILLAPIAPPNGTNAPVPREAEPAVATPAAPEVDLEPAAEPALDQPLPGFAQPQSAARVWRIPLVSSFLITTCGLLLLHYL